MTVQRVLVADDSRVFRAWVADLLRDRGLEVLEAANGREAVDLAVANRPCLLLLDALMPLLSGFDVITKVREKLPDYRPVVFIVTGVYKSRRWESEARRTHHIDEYLEKPLEEQSLLKALERHREELGLLPG
jgi:two-component system, sensor histidine kinase and response regulator